MVVSPPAAETIFERFEIEFDAGTEPVFHGGELVTGSLKIQLKNETTINAIRIQFRGRSVFLGPNSKKVPEGQTEKIYFDKDFVLLERPPGHPEPGHFPWNANFLYSLPFECPLPKGCESSYEGPHGFIRYYARAVLETDEPYKAKYLIKKAFSIVSPPELHQLVPPQSEPIAEKKSIPFGGCCCFRGKMNAEIHLPKSAYAPGENIVGTFSMDARTAKNAIGHIEVRLVDRLKRILDQPELIPIGNNNTADEAVPTTEAAVNGTGKKQKRKEKKQPAPPKKKRTSAEGGKEECQCQRVVAGRKLSKEDLGGQLDNAKRAQTITQANVLFIRVPAINPSTQIEREPKSLQQSMLFDESEALENGQFHRLLESPSTATLRARKEPFLRVDYALQISLGTQVLMELPIQVHPIPIYAKGTEFRPFAAGAQPIGEQDEAGLIPFNGPFTFTPQYPIYIESPKFSAIEQEVPMPVDQIQVQQITTLAPARGQVPNGVHGEGQQQQITTNVVTVVENENSGPVQPEYQLEKSQNELDQQPIPTDSGQRNVEKQQDTTVQAAEGPSTTSTTTMDNGPVEHKHAEHDEQLANGHNVHTTVDEWKQNGGDGEIRRVVEEEHYEQQNEDGSRVTVQKTTEKISTVETHVEMLNGGEEQAGDEPQQDGAVQQPAENGGGTQPQQLQMDVSMSG